LSCARRVGGRAWPGLHRLPRRGIARGPWSRQRPSGRGDGRRRDDRRSPGCAGSP